MLSNTDRSAIEVQEFINNPPDRYFLYIDEKKQIATTWTGEKLGTVMLGRSHRSNMGDVRQCVWVRGINGVRYWGWYYKSAGDYARIYAYKDQEVS